jgi:guanylate kinase
MPQQGTLYIISAPSGTGKTTLVKALTDTIPTLTVSISHTTRPKRPAETHGRNYYFIDEAEFQRMIEKREFLEYATVFNHYYGTSRSWVEETLLKGLDVILEIDWQGAQQIQYLFPNCVSIFILPPSLQALSERLINRNQDQPDIIKQRLFDVREATSHIDEYTYVILNDDFTSAVEELKTIMVAGRLLTPKQHHKYTALLQELVTAGKS